MGANTRTVDVFKSLFNIILALALVITMTPLPAYASNDDGVLTPGAFDATKLGDDGDGDSDNEDQPSQGAALIEDNNSSLLTMSSLSPDTRNALTRGNPSRNAEYNFEPITVEGTTLSNLRMHWLSASTGQTTPAGMQRLYLAPTEDVVPAHQFQLDFQLSGKDRYEIGDIEIVLPDTIWHTRDGEASMTLDANGLAVVEEGFPGSERAEFVWKRIDNSIVITNNRRMPAGSSVMIQGHFEGEAAHNIIDMTVSDGMWCSVSVIKASGAVLSATSNTIDAQLDTYQNVTAANKTAYSANNQTYWVYATPPADMPGEFVPANADDYVYVKWYISGKMGGNQPAVLSFNDSNLSHNGIVLGATGTFDGTVRAENGVLNARLYNGYSTDIKSAYVWTAYPYSAFPVGGQTYNVSNSASVKATGFDDALETEMVASATAPVIAPKTYTVTKRWDDNSNQRGYRPSSTTVKVWRSSTGSSGSYEEYKTLTLSSANNWTATWRDEELKSWHYKVSEFDNVLTTRSVVTKTGTRTYTTTKDTQPGIQEQPRVYTSPVFDNARNVFWSYKFEGTSFDDATSTFTLTNKLYEKTPQTHRIVKRWLGDNNNAAGNRPATLDVWVAKDLVMANAQGIIQLSGMTHDWVNFAQPYPQNNQITYPNTYYDENGYLVSGQWLKLTLTDSGNGEYVGYFTDDDPYSHKYSVHEFEDLRDFGGHKKLGRVLIAGEDTS